MVKDVKCAKQCSRLQNICAIWDAKIKSKEGTCLNLHEVVEMPNCVTEVDGKETGAKFSTSS